METNPPTRLNAMATAHMDSMLPRHWGARSSPKWRVERVIPVIFTPLAERKAKVLSAAKIFDSDAAFEPRWASMALLKSFRDICSDLIAAVM